MFGIVTSSVACIERSCYKIKTAALWCYGVFLHVVNFVSACYFTLILADHLLLFNYINFCAQVRSHWNPGRKLVSNDLA